MHAIDATNRFPAAVANQMNRLAEVDGVTDLFTPISQTGEVCARGAIKGADFHAILLTLRRWS